MSDENALLAAIAAHPAEDTPRLVYADWLDENDRPLRAEFIRLQCRIKRLEADHAGAPGRSAALSAQVHLWKRQEELIAHHRDALLGPLANVLDHSQLGFDRGFLPHLRLEARLFLAHAPRVAALSPPTEITVSEAVACPDELFAAPELSAVTRLAMRGGAGWGGALGAATVRRLGQLGGHNRLRALDLRGCVITDLGLTYLAEYDETWKVDTLDLSGNGIEEAGLLALLRSAIPGRLRRLSLSSNPLTAVALRALIREWPAGARLEYLSLAGVRGAAQLPSGAFDERFGQVTLY